jgi:4-amino-4-deoxychorismate lyase
MTDDGALVLLEHPAGTTNSGKPRLADPADPHLHLDDLGVLRGYGAFEVVHGIDRKVIAAEDHLSRLERSCARLSLPRIHWAAWREAMDLAIHTHDDEGEFALRLVLTGGTGAAESMRGWIRYERVADSFVEKRSRSLSATLLDRGIAAGCADRAPWLLIGVKSLSYGPNMAAIREAQRRGADEAVYVSSDGYVLEAPTSSALIRQGDTRTVAGNSPWDDPTRPVRSGRQAGPQRPVRPRPSLRVGIGGRDVAHGEHAPGHPAG